MNLLIHFTILTMLNVILSTVKSIVTIKCGKGLASLVSASYYGFYNIVIIYTVSDFPIFYKVIITFGCNLIGVYLVKWLEEKAEKEKMWRFDCTAQKDNSDSSWEKLIQFARDHNISYKYTDINKYVTVDCYCETKVQSSLLKEYLKGKKIKYFIDESK